MLVVKVPPSRATSRTFLARRVLGNSISRTPNGSVRQQVKVGKKPVFSLTGQEKGKLLFFSRTRCSLSSTGVHRRRTLISTTDPLFSGYIFRQVQATATRQRSTLVVVRG